MHHAGSCLCGGVKFKIAGPLAPVQVCHCAQCRKAQGGPFATNIPVATQSLTLEDSDGLLTSYESSPGKERLFCRRCGSPVLSRRTAIPGFVRVRAGLIDEPVHVALDFHAFTESKASWWNITDDLPQHPAGFVQKVDP